MATTTRAHGTKVHKPATPAERIAAFRSIVEEKQYAKIDGVMIDLFTASVVVQVYDALSAEAKKKFEKFGDARAMAAIAFKVLKKAEGR